MKCDNCQKQNQEGKNFCGECGNPITEVAKKHFPEMIKSKQKESYLSKFI